MSPGKQIVLAFVLFAAFIFFMALVSMRQDVNLVSKNYYAEEQLHDHKMAGAANAAGLDAAPRISFATDTLRVSFARFSDLETGRLRLLRPSDSRLDNAFLLRPSADTVQYFKLPLWSPGLYRVSMQWRMDGREFYIERPIVF